MTEDNNGLTRRKLIKTGAAATLTSAAGCLDGDEDKTETDTSSTETGTDNATVEVYRRSTLSSSDIERIEDWQNSSIRGLEWDEVDERRDELYNRISEVEDDIEDEGVTVPLGQGAVREFGNGVTLYEDTRGSDEGSLTLADIRSFGTRFEDIVPEAIWPSFRNQSSSRNMQTPKQSGEISTDYERFIDNSGLPTDFIQGEEDDQALAIAANLGIYLGDMSGDQGLQINEEFVDDLVGTPNREGKLDRAIEEVRELENDWIDYLNGGESDSITRYMRAVAGNNDYDGEIDEIIDILEDSDRDTKTVSQREYNRNDEYVAYSERELLKGNLENVEDEIIREFERDRTTAAELSMVARALENARSEIRSKASNYEWEEEDEPDNDDDEPNDDNDDEDKDDSEIYEGGYVLSHENRTALLSDLDELYHNEEDVLNQLIDVDDLPVDIDDTETLWDGAYPYDIDHMYIEGEIKGQFENKGRDDLEYDPEVDKVRFKILDGENRNNPIWYEKTSFDYDEASSEEMLDRFVEDLNEGYNDIDVEYTDR